MVVTTERHGKTGLIVVDNPPVNALSQAVRSGILEAVQTLDADPEIDVIALLAEGRTFIAGADIREFSAPPSEPLLPAVAAAIVGSATPVVCVIHGTALGGGFEMALASHARVALAGAKVGLPETTLGIIPGAGGTQRAPRLAGIVATADLVISGKPISAGEALKKGLVDRVVEGTPREAALAAAEAVRDGSLATRRTDALPPAEPAPDEIAGWRAELAARPGTFALEQAVSALEASSGPIEDGLATERLLFETCRASPERAARVHIFFAEREASKVPELKRAEPRPIARVGVIGGGTMGAGIAAACLLSGYDVTMVERDDEGAARGRATVEGVLDGSVKRGRLSADKRANMAFSAGSDFADLADCDLVIEAAFEDMAVKKELFGRLGEVARADAVLATNTSYLDVDEIAAASGRAGDVVGLHFFSPAYVMKLLEVVVGEKTAPDVVATAFTVAKRLGKIAVWSGVGDGFIGNRIFLAYRRTADIMMEDGASPYDIDRALVAWGLPMGPYQAADFAGQDIGWATRKRRAATRDPNERYVAIADKVCERGWFGRKTGRGFYLYPEGAKSGVPDPEVLALIEEERRAKGIVPRNFTDEEIVNRILCTMVNEGARAVDAGVARQASDVDVVMVNGYGFPRFRGGPMKAADIAGLPGILDDLKRFAADDATAFAPARLIEECVAAGRPLV
ncbi:3-hydroxyacyl-CoA dehydrogenase NAD-binding domain-containing protein [Acuticoccus mangrovi]|uniref:Enoyl-CoA hydratase/isomerase family protein n=1 Tax=Acuticoccus mangrovi TaxID=2796142 RepID=A0A934MHB3_9HYPH|nr:3-hydroxyacyl-CoA dehydrogenase NAD-binding domain-containing protein [Acuticoccus mangrovi]MBJ3777478.1 enoyl-CoA hydratase/isomerase family protein [Acuticoccus mangrovi]